MKCLGLSYGVFKKDIDLQILIYNQQQHFHDLNG